jgi:hypothetical protein
MLVSLFAFFIALQPLQAGKDEVKETLARAESLYYEAKFTEAVQMLAQLNDDLQTKPERLQDRISVKLQLSLAHIGMNNPAVAKLFLIEIFLLQPDFTLDAQQYSPKVLAIADEARTETNRVRCQRASEDARKGLVANDAPSLLNVLRTMKPRCSELSAFEPETAELVYRTGMQDYKQGDLRKAAENFRTALQFAPKHEMAAQYLDLAETKLQLAEDRVATNAMKVEYKKAIDGLAEWNRACAAHDAAKMTELRSQYKDLPACTPPAEQNVVALAKVDTNPGCFEMQSQAALTRLKQRVEPEFSREARTFLQNQKVTLHVKALIDEGGNVTVGDITGSNAVVNGSVKTAVEKWKFLPAMDQSGVSRCVVTEILMALGN